MIVLGVDPGLANFGWAIIRDGSKPELLASGAVTTPASATQDQRLRVLWLHLHGLVREHRPRAIGVEDYAYHGQARDARTAEVLGTVASLAHLYGLPIFRCRPQQWRKAIGAGRSATKADVKRLLEGWLGWKLPNQHAADAAAVGLWAGTQIIGGAHEV